MAASTDFCTAAGYDLAIPGNHEFDYGMDNFLSLATEKAEYSYICSNFTDLDGKAVFEPYKRHGLLDLLMGVAIDEDVDAGGVGNDGLGLPDIGGAGVAQRHLG